MTKPHVIGLSGKKLAGKDTLYAQCRKQLGNVATRLAFGDIVKLEVANTCKFFDDTEETLGFIEAHKARFRPLLQWWGTEYRRHFDGESYWIDAMRTRLGNIPSHFKYVFITDIRFPDEASLVRELNGSLIRVERGGVHTDQHSTETVMDDYSEYDCTINNRGGLPQLAFEARMLIAKDFCRRVACKEKKVTTDNNDSPRPSPSPV
jgi:hypothetical protein